MVIHYKASIRRKCSLNLQFLRWSNLYWNTNQKIKKLQFKKQLVMSFCTENNHSPQHFRSCLRPAIRYHLKSYSNMLLPYLNTLTVQFSIEMLIMTIPELFKRNNLYSSQSDFILSQLDPIHTLWFSLSTLISSFPILNNLVLNRVHLQIMVLIY